MKKRTLILIVILGIIAILIISIALMSKTEEFQSARRSVLEEKVVDKKYQGAYIGDDYFSNQKITLGETSISGELTIRDVRTKAGGIFKDENEINTWAYVYARTPSSSDAKIGLVWDDSFMILIALGEEANIWAEIMQEIYGIANIETTGYDETYNWSGYNE